MIADEAEWRSPRRPRCRHVVETAGRTATWSPAKRLRAPNEAIRAATRSTYTTDPTPDSAESSARPGGA
jgi:hypothetical protein